MSDLFTHVFGHELRLEMRGELLASEVCRNDDEVLGCQERWRAGLEAKGWTTERRPVITSEPNVLRL